MRAFHLALLMLIPFGAAASQGFRLDGAIQESGLSLSGGTVTGAVCFYGSSSSVCIDSLADGALTTYGSGGANDEDWVCDYETIPDVIACASTTGVTQYITASPTAYGWFGGVVYDGITDGSLRVHNNLDTAGITLDVDDVTNTLVVKDRVGTAAGNLTVAGTSTLSTVTVGAGGQWVAGTSDDAILLQEVDTPTDNVCLKTSGDLLYVYQGDCSTGTTVVTSVLLATTNLYSYNATGGQARLLDTTTPGAAAANGDIVFQAYDAAGSPVISNYARIQGHTVDPTDTAEDGKLAFEVMDNGTAATEFLRLDATDNSEGVVTGRPVRQNALTTHTPAGTTQTITWTGLTGNITKLDLEDASGNVTLTISNAGIGRYTYIIQQDGAGAARNVVWPAAFKWANATTPVISTGNDAIDIVDCICDGTTHYCSISQDHQ